MLIFWFICIITEFMHIIISKRRENNLNIYVKKIVVAGSVFAVFPCILTGLKHLPSISSDAGKFVSFRVGESNLQTTEIITETGEFFTDPVSQGIGIEEFSEGSEDTELVIMQADENSGEKPYPTEWNICSSGSIVKTTYEAFSGGRYFNLTNAGQVQNKTSVGNDKLYSESLSMPEFQIKKTTEEPQVLIMHTHTTESYEPYEREKYDLNFNYRTTDSRYNMVSVGDKICEELEKEGIGVIHSDTIHDYPSYNGSYERSAETVKSILEEYPSIKVVLDIHRDAISDGDNLVAPVCESDGEEAAQIMIISGCDDGTMDMPNYMQNFRFACMLQTQLELDHSGFTRPILFDYRKYNQNLTTGSLLIEVGSHGNTLEQAQNAGKWIGKSLASCLKNLSEE